MNVKPVININNEGKAETYGKPLTEKSSIKMAMRQVDQKAKGRKVWGYAISHANNPSTANWYAGQMEEKFGLKPRFVNDASPVLGCNTGPGVVALSIMFED